VPSGEEAVMILRVVVTSDLDAYRGEPEPYYGSIPRPIENARLESYQR
jgi:hypothetical protein